VTAAAQDLDLVATSNAFSSEVNISLNRSQHDMERSNRRTCVARIGEHCRGAVLGPVPLGWPRFKRAVVGSHGRFCSNYWMADARLLGSIPSVPPGSDAQHDPWSLWDTRWDCVPYHGSDRRVDDSTGRCNGRAHLGQRVLVADFQIETMMKDPIVSATSY
jgi:hypothetical protein